MHLSILALFHLWTWIVLSSISSTASSSVPNPESSDLQADDFDKCLDILQSVLSDTSQVPEPVPFKEVLLEAVAKKNYKRIRKVLKVSRLSSPDFLLSNGETILSNFVVLDDLEGVRFAIDTLGCDVNYRIQKTLTTDFALRRCRSRQMFRLLVQKGADVNARLEFHPNLQHFTMLHYAVVNNFAWIVDELIRAGVDDKIVDSYGNRASTIAAYYGNQDILGYLRKLQ